MLSTGRRLHAGRQLHPGRGAGCRNYFVCTRAFELRAGRIANEDRRRPGTDRRTWTSAGAPFTRPQGPVRGPDAGPALRFAPSELGNRRCPRRERHRCCPVAPSSAARTAGTFTSAAGRAIRPSAGTRLAALGAGRMRATRGAVALYDQSSFSKLLLRGRDALAVLQRLCANEVDVPIDRMVYADAQQARRLRNLTVIRMQPDRNGERWLIVTGSAQAVRDFDWISRHRSRTSTRC